MLVSRFVREAIDAAPLYASLDHRPDVSACYPRSRELSSYMRTLDRGFANVFNQACGYYQLKRFAANGGEANLLSFVEDAVELRSLKDPLTRVARAQSILANYSLDAIFRGMGGALDLNLQRVSDMSPRVGGNAQQQPSASASCGIKGAASSITSEEMGGRGEGLFDEEGRRFYRGSRSSRFSVHGAAQFVSEELSGEAFAHAARHLNGVPCLLLETYTLAGMVLPSPREMWESAVLQVAAVAVASRGTRGVSSTYSRSSGVHSVGEGMPGGDGAVADAVGNDGGGVASSTSAATSCHHGSSVGIATASSASSPPSRTIIYSSIIAVDVLDGLIVAAMVSLLHGPGSLYSRFLASGCFALYAAMQHATFAREQIVTRDSFLWLKALGRGGYGMVYAAQKIDTGKLYAIKRMDKRLIKVRHATRMIMNERDMLASVNHPFVTGLQYAFHDDAEVCFVLDLASGGDLEHYLLALHRRFSENEIRFIAAEILLGTKYLHEQGIMHRDLKPANVLLDNEGHVSISDLGLAAFYTPATPTVSRSTTPVRQSTASSLSQTLPSPTTTSLTSATSTTAVTIAAMSSGLASPGALSMVLFPYKTSSAAAAAAAAAATGLSTPVASRASTPEPRVRHRRASLASTIMLLSSARAAETSSSDATMSSSAAAASAVADAAVACDAHVQTSASLSSLQPSDFNETLRAPSMRNVPPQGGWGGASSAHDSSLPPPHRVGASSEQRFRSGSLTASGALSLMQRSTGLGDVTVTTSGAASPPSSPHLRRCLSAGSTRMGGCWDAGLSFAGAKGTGVSACEAAGYMYGSTEVGVRGKAGTPGFWAPEMLHYEQDGKGRRYGAAADWFSFGCFLYALAAARGPFTVLGGDTADDNAATLQLEPELSRDAFSPRLASLLSGLLQKDPAQRLGCGVQGVEEIQSHPFFTGVDWAAIAAKQVTPPFRPTVNVLESTRVVRGWGEKDLSKIAGVILLPEDQSRYKGIPFVSQVAVHKELIQNAAMQDHWGLAASEAAAGTTSTRGIAADSSNKSSRTMQQLSTRKSSSISTSSSVAVAVGAAAYVAAKSVPPTAAAAAVVAMHSQQRSAPAHGVSAPMRVRAASLSITRVREGGGQHNLSASASSISGLSTSGPPMAVRLPQHGPAAPVRSRRLSFGGDGGRSCSIQ